MPEQDEDTTEPKRPNLNDQHFEEFERLRNVASQELKESGKVTADKAKEKEKKKVAQLQGSIIGGSMHKRVGKILQRQSQRSRKTWRCKATTMGFRQLLDLSPEISLTSPLKTLSSNDETHYSIG